VQALPPSSLTNPETGGPGARVRYLDDDGGELAREDRLWVELVWLGSGLPSGTATVEVATRWAAEPGRHLLGARALGALHLTVDGETVLDTVTTSDADRFIGAFADPPSVSVEVDLAAPVELVLRHTLVSPIRAVTLGVQPVLDDPDAEIAAAVALARECAVALVVVGTNEQVESEGFDRDSLALPGRQDDLVRAVAAANPRTVVLVNSGAPVLLPWRDEVAAVLLGWFGGERFGEAVADVLLGHREPGGRLPTTWPATGAERAVLSGVPVDGRLDYAEGLHVGHRGWLRSGETPAYPFGHGLGYTTWELRAARATVSADGSVAVEVELANTGGRPGRQVVQVYLSRAASAVERPARWLAGWAVVDAEPGPTTATVTLTPRAFAHWVEPAQHGAAADGASGDGAAGDGAAGDGVAGDGAAGWRVEPGEFTVHVGTSVAETPLTATVTV
jgi:beta-glucosidase